MKKSKKNNKGFSLVELIVVVLILGILAVAVTPQIMTWIDKSHIAKDESYAGTVSSTIEAVALEWIGEGKQDDISTAIVIGDGTMSFTGGSDDFKDAVVAAFTADNSYDKCEEPSQNSMNIFAVTIHTNTTNKTVSVTTVASHS